MRTDDSIHIEKKMLTTNLYAFRSRTRVSTKLSEDQLDYRCNLEKRWAQYKQQERQELNATCERLLSSQVKALEELRSVSEILYQAAIQPMDVMVPFTVKGPVYTAPIKNYFPPAKYRSAGHFFSQHCCST